MFILTKFSFLTATGGISDGGKGVLFYLTIRFYYNSLSWSSYFLLFPPQSKKYNIISKKPTLANMLDKIIIKM